MSAAVLFRHPSSVLHDTGSGHPERAARIVAIEETLTALGWLGYEVRESPAATDEQLGAVHPASHTDALRALCADGGGWIDGDTVTSPDSFDAALHAAGGACSMVDALLTGGASTGASVHRPPGHHAEAAQAMGFCLVNNVAIAARHAVRAHGVRVAIVDWDVHHGNGTNDIFRADPEVLFCSIHESPLYPGTGPVEDSGTGEAAGRTVNLPVPGGSGDETFCSLVEHVVAPLLAAFEPGLVLISAGYDAHADDPLAGCAVTDAGYARMARAVRAAATAAGAPVGLVLEGGYDLGALSRGLSATLAALSGEDGAAADPALAEHPLATAARERLATWWPALAGDAPA
ncbi:histone deacetylase [Paraconexibacter antarcticus]|uniref:Histone deacetylase n=1 Tax=Paraconexibacter antarcticus TaxID=2949664 RepID=A0ABY5E1J6_9ACTN|nr:histone deacetylase [Paraconexibacter antarcticus]UTI66967.1 histone deacetylase [Paraconexibacter antarcticus]